MFFVLKIPDALMGTLPSPGRQMYLYAIHITPAGESAAPQTVFGLVTKRELTTVSFHLCSNTGRRFRIREITSNKGVNYKTFVYFIFYH